MTNGVLTEMRWSGYCFGNEEDDVYIYREREREKERGKGQHCHVIEFSGSRDKKRDRLGDT